MKPNPFASLTHFPRLGAWRAPSLRVLQPLLCSRRSGGVALHAWRTNKNATRLDLARRVSRSTTFALRKRFRFEPERRKLYTKARGRSTRFLRVPMRHVVLILGRIWPPSKT